MYLRELDAVQPLTKDEESYLLRQVQSQDAQAESASRRLIEANLSLVVVIAERHSSSGIPMLDLIEKGNLGLMLALKTFPENSSDTLETYAANYIQEAVSKAIAESQSANDCPRRLSRGLPGVGFQKKKLETNGDARAGGPAASTRVRTWHQSFP